MQSKKLKRIIKVFKDSKLAEMSFSWFNRGKEEKFHFKAQLPSDPSSATNRSQHVPKNARPAPINDESDVPDDIPPIISDPRGKEPDPIPFAHDKIKDEPDIPQTDSFSGSGIKNSGKAKKHSSPPFPPRQKFPEIISDHTYYLFDLKRCIKSKERDITLSIIKRGAISDVSITGHQLVSNENKYYKNEWQDVYHDVRNSLDTNVLKIFGSNLSKWNIYNQLRLVVEYKRAVHRYRSTVYYYKESFTRQAPFEHDYFIEFVHAKGKNGKPLSIIYAEMDKSYERNGIIPPKYQLIEKMIKDNIDNVNHWVHHNFKIKKQGEGFQNWEISMKR